MFINKYEGLIWLYRTVFTILRNSNQWRKYNIVSCSNKKWLTALPISGCCTFNKMLTMYIFFIIRNCRYRCIQFFRDIKRIPLAQSIRSVRFSDFESFKNILTLIYLSQNGIHTHWKPPCRYRNPYYTWFSFRQKPTSLSIFDLFKINIYGMRKCRKYVKAAFTTRYKMFIIIVFSFRTFIFLFVVTLH